MESHESKDKLHLHMALDKIVTMEEKINTMEEKINAIEDTTIKVLGIGEPFKFKLKKFTEIKDRCEEFRSPPFYTGPSGYLMTIRVYPYRFTSHVAKGTHVSVYVKLLEGKNNKELPWPFVGNATFTLLNHLEDAYHYEHKVDITSASNIRPKGASYGFHLFISHSDLSHSGKTQYLKDDTLCFRVSVGVPCSKPWLE